MTKMNGSVLKVNNLKTYFFTRHGVVKAVEGINYELTIDFFVKKARVER